MKRYIDFVQKPKKGQPKVEEETAFVSVPEKKPTTTPVRPATTARPSAAHPAAPVRPAATTPVHPHYKPDFGPARKKPLGSTTPRPATPVRSTVSHSAARPVTARPSTSVSSARPAIKPVARPAVKPASRPTAKPVEKPVEKSVNASAGNDIDSIFGVIEDYHPVSQPPEIKKRPLSNGEPAPRHFFSRKSQADTREAQAAEVIKEAETVDVPPKKTIPKTPFIRTAAIEKRPLSNSYTPKKPDIPTKEPSDPATIIEKPEKDAHVGIIVTVVLTIVFGAALGTAAFLLLAK